jgi:hypothetical protein
VVAGVPLAGLLSCLHAGRNQNDQQHDAAMSSFGSLCNDTPVIGESQPTPSGQLRISLPGKGFFGSCRGASGVPRLSRGATDPNEGAPWAASKVQKTTIFQCDERAVAAMARTLSGGRSILVAGVRFSAPGCCFL